MPSKPYTRQAVVHPIPPLFNAQSRVLILGSFPSVKSREQGFFYGHPQNRFWPLLAALHDAQTPKTIPGKRDFALEHGIALWDVIASCEIVGSSDSSIQNVVPNDLSVILRAANIRAIFTNGKTADRFYQKYTLQNTGIPAVCLPSTSPANASYSLERLKTAWRVLLEYA